MIWQRMHIAEDKTIGTKGSCIFLSVLHRQGCSEVLKDTSDKRSLKNKKSYK